MIVDTGPLYAIVDADDAEHARCVRTLADRELSLVIPALVIAESTYLIGSRLGPTVEAEFLAGLAGLDVEAPHPDDYPRMAELVRDRADFPLGGIDASIVALAERLGIDTIMTLDRRHFGAVRPRHCDTFRLLP